MIKIHLIFNFYILFINSCFQQLNHINYLFLNDLSQIKIPLIPLDCLLCQSAYQIDIQLIDKEFNLNRTIQRIKINLKNFEIDDSSYICLRNICPIFFEYGSDSIILNITSTVFSHVYLSLIYLKNSILCSIQTHFSIYLLNKSLTCTNKIYFHPKLDIEIFGEFKIYDCQMKIFYENIYQKTIKFYHEFINNEKLIMKTTENTCEYILQNLFYLNKSSLIQKNQISTFVYIYPIYNPWKKIIQILGPCYTKIISYREMSFTENIANVRNIYIKQGETIRIECPIDGSEKYIKYIWYYQRYQPKYQISNNRTIILRNITKQMQGKYMCIADDKNEKLEFEMILYLSKNQNHSFYLIIIFILFIFLILSCFLLIIIIYFSLKKSSIKKQNSLIIHHDVLLTIQHFPQQQQTINSLWNQDPYQTLNYIDKQSIYIKQKQIPHNVNRQLSINIPLIKSNSDMTLSSIRKSNEINDIKILKISVPLLNQYSLIKSSNSIISFDSQYELNEFNQMSIVCMDND